MRNVARSLKTTDLDAEPHTESSRWRSRSTVRRGCIFTFGESEVHTVVDGMIPRHREVCRPQREVGIWDERDVMLDGRECRLYRVGGKVAALRLLPERAGYLEQEQIRRENRRAHHGFFGRLCVRLVDEQLDHNTRVDDCGHT